MTGRALKRGILVMSLAASMLLSACGMPQYMYDDLQAQYVQCQHKLSACHAEAMQLEQQLASKCVQQGG